MAGNNDAQLNGNERSALARLKQALGRDFPLVELRLFGSKARGDAQADSDLDVMVVLRQSDWATRKAVSALCFDISVESGVVISPVVVTPERLNSRLARVTPFYQAVAREGVAV